MQLAPTSFDRAILLTGQPYAAQPGTIVSPKGLTIWLGLRSRSPKLVTLQISAQPRRKSARLTIDNQEVSA